MLETNRHTAQMSTKTHMCLHITHTPHILPRFHDLFSIPKDDKVVGKGNLRTYTEKSEGRRFFPKIVSTPDSHVPGVSYRKGSNGTLRDWGEEEAAEEGSKKSAIYHKRLFGRASISGVRVSRHLENFKWAWIWLRKERSTKRGHLHFCQRHSK